MEKTLTDLGLTATPDQLQQILVTCQQTGIAHHRPLKNDEVLSIALAAGAVYGDF